MLSHWSWTIETGYGQDYSSAAASSSLFENLAQRAMSSLARLFARSIAVHRTPDPGALPAAVDFPYIGPGRLLLSAYLDRKTVHFVFHMASFRTGCVRSTTNGGVVVIVRNAATNRHREHLGRADAGPCHAHPSDQMVAQNMKLRDSLECRASRTRCRVKRAPFKSGGPGCRIYRFGESGSNADASIAVDRAMPRPSWSKLATQTNPACPRKR